MNDLPSHLVAVIDQQHARAEASLTELLSRLRAQGLAEADPAYRVHVIGIGLRHCPHRNSADLAAAAVSRLLDEPSAAGQRGPNSRG